MSDTVLNRDNDEGKEHIVELKQFVHFLWSWAWLIVLCAAAAGIAAYAGSQDRTTTYTATTTLLINASSPNRDGLSLNSQDEREYLVNTYMTLLNKRPVFELVIESLGLDMSPRYLAERVTISPIPSTQLLEIAVEDTNPQRAATIANEIVAVFNEQEADLTANPYAANRPSLHIVESAVPPTSASGVSSIQITLLAIVVGALLGGGAAVLMDYVDMTIRSAKQIERLTGWTTLASIPRIKSAEPHDTLATLTNTQPSTAEAYRMVRAYIEFATHGQPVHTLMVTSAHPGEGKSVTAANLAVALAQTGLRVVLVDTNLWKPRLHTLFQQANESGFTTAIQQQGKQPATDYLVSSSVKNLHLLPSGPVPDNPLALLTSGSLVRLIAELLEQADLILFDSPPLLHAVDATLLMPAIDAALYVVRAGKTHQDTLLQVQQHFDRVQTRVLGAMLIDTPVGNTRSYGYIATAADANVSASPVHEIPARLWIQSRHITRHPPPAAPETVENKNASMQEPVRKRKL